MPAELRPEGDGWTCPEHPAYAPQGLTQRHATNSLAKHNREHHADDQRTADLSGLIETLIRSPHFDGDDETAQWIAHDLADAGFTRPPF